MTPTLTPLIHRATLAIGDEKAARRIADLLTEGLGEGEAAVAAFEGPTGRWDITVHFADTPDQDTIRELVRLAAGENAAQAVQFDTVEPKDWVKATLDALVPVHAGRFVVHGAHDRAKVAANRLGIEIEAALAFGTGHHGTTQGCLAAIERIAKTKRPKRILDIGTGTGVLAIAAARIWRRDVIACDIDPQSVTVARANTEANRAGAYVRVVQAAGINATAIRGRRFDLVLANILLPVLKDLARPVRRFSARSATVVLSGLLPEQANAVLAVWRAQGFVLLRRDIVEDWVTLTLARP
jgi:ribosomal protein L11 methyltransferase